MLKQKIFKSLSVAALLIIPLSLLAQTVDPVFDAGKLIDDKVFSDTQTFGGAAGIQKFLESKQSVLAGSAPDFLVKLKEPAALLLKQGLDDPEPNLGRLRTAAELIWDASLYSGLNPQVILVTLNKEQGLIGNQFRSEADLQTALDHAMGFACPDSTGCGDLFPGFYYQLFGNFDSSGNRYLGAAKSLMKSFTAAGGRGPGSSHTGDALTLDNTLGGFENILPQQGITLSNNATAALYRYTPHVFNGNYNFWKFFNAWFKYPNGTLIKLASASDIYIIQNGLKQLVPPFVAEARGLIMSSTITVSPTEFASFKTDLILGPLDNTIVAVSGDAQKYVFIGSIKHPASDLVIKQRGLDPANTLAISALDSALFQNGSVLPPKDGTIVRGQKDSAVYLVQNGSLQMFSAFTFSQRKIPSKKITVILDAEVATYPKLGFVAPLDGTLFKSKGSQTVFLTQNGLKQPVTAEVFKNRRIKPGSIAILSLDEVNAIPYGTYATPADKSFFSVSETGQLYMFKEGSKHSVSVFAAKQRGIIADFKINQDIATQWQDGIPVAPRDGTLIKGEVDGTIFLVKNGQLDPLTSAAFKNHRYNPKNIKILPQTEVDAYAKGDVIVK